MDWVTILIDALAPLGEWLLAIGGTGILIALGVKTLIWGWGLIRYMIDGDGWIGSDHYNSWKSDFDRDTRGGDN